MSVGRENIMPHVIIQLPKMIVATYEFEAFRAGIPRVGFEYWSIMMTTNWLSFFVLRSGPRVSTAL